MKNKACQSHLELALGEALIYVRCGQVELEERGLLGTEVEEAASSYLAWYSRLQVRVLRDKMEKIVSPFSTQVTETSTTTY